MLSYVVQVGEFTNTDIIDWTNKNKYRTYYMRTSYGNNQL